MAIIAELAPRTFVYSIDEAFVDLSGIANPHQWGCDAKEVIFRRTGMPVGVGIGPTKTLAKLANWAAKKWKAKTGGVVELLDPVRQEKLLRYAPVDEVWGIGSRLTKRLNEDHGIRTAWQLAQACPKHLRRHFNVNVERTARELHGIECLPFNDDAAKKQMIACTRSFGKRLTALPELESAVAKYVANAAEKLRRQESLTDCLQVFIRTSWFDSPDQRYGRSLTISLSAPTADTRLLTHAALDGLRELYRPGYQYAKAGIILTHMVDAEGYTPDLFCPGDSASSQRVMSVVDQINRRMGRGSVRFARTDAEPGWAMRRQFLTPCYMTQWSDLQKVRC